LGHGHGYRVARLGTGNVWSRGHSGDSGCNAGQLRLGHPDDRKAERCKGKATNYSFEHANPFRYESGTNGIRNANRRLGTGIQAGKFERRYKWLPAKKSPKIAASGLEHEV
jgi:hypothetical protein